MRFGGQEEKRRLVAEGQLYSCAFSKHRVAEAPNNVMDQPTPFSLEQYLRLGVLGAIWPVVGYVWRVLRTRNSSRLRPVTVVVAAGREGVMHVLNLAPDRDDTTSKFKFLSQPCFITFKFFSRIVHIYMPFNTKRS